MTIIPFIPLDEQSIHDTVEKPPSYKPWRVVAAVCLQRFPTLSLLSSPLAAKMETLKDVQRVERSRRSDFELEEAEYLRKKRERERRALEEDPDETQVSVLRGRGRGEGGGGRGRGEAVVF